MMICGWFFFFGRVKLSLLHNLKRVKEERKRDVHAQFFPVTAQNVSLC